MLLWHVSEGQGFNPATKGAPQGSFRSAEGWSAGATGSDRIAFFYASKAV
jgi:hypothetical protein